MGAEAKNINPQRLKAKDQIVRVSRDNFLSKVIPYIHGTNTDVFDPESVATAKHHGADHKNSTITTSHRLTSRLLNQSTLPEWLELPGNYPDILKALALAFFGDSEVSAFDNPDVMIGKFAEACKDPEVINNWEFKIGWGGHPDVSPRLPAYLIPMLDAAKRFQEQGLPVPKITVFNGVNAASFCNYDHEANATELLREARETNHHLITAFVNKFAPGIKINFENDDVWTEGYLAKTDEVVERLMDLAQYNPPLRRVLYELCVAGSQHQQGVTDPIKNSLRYVVQHLDYFSEVLREGEKSDPNHAVFNWINAKEMEFGFARKELRKVLPDERIGPRACDIRMDNISSQQTPYYPQAGIDAPLGKWEDIYRNNHSLSAGGGSNGDFSLSSYWHIMIAFLIEKREHVGKKTFRDYVRDFAKRHSQDERLLDDVGENVPANLLNQNQQIGALYDWVAIGRKINPQNPKAGLETYLKFLGEFEQSAEGREFQRKREKLQSQLPKHVDKKDHKKSPPSAPSSSDSDNRGSGGTPQPPSPKVDSPSEGDAAVPSAGGGYGKREQPINAVGTGRVDGGQGRTTDSTDRITWQDYMGFPSSPHDPSPPWVSGTMEDFISNIATPEVLGEWFTSLNNPQIPHKNKAMIASFVDQALSLQRRGKLNIPTSLIKAMQNALDNHISAIRPQNTSSNGQIINRSSVSQGLTQVSSESVANFAKQTKDEWTKEMQRQAGTLANMAQVAAEEGIDTARKLGQDTVEQIQKTAEYANDMWQSLPPEAQSWIEKEGLKTIVWTAAASMVLSPLGALAAGPIMTASTDFIVEAVKKGSELLAHHPDIPRDDIVAALSGAVASVGLIPFLGPLAPLAGAGAGVMAKRLIQHGVPPLIKGTIEHGPHIASSTVKAAACTVVAGANMTKAVIQPAAKLLEGHDEAKARIALHGLPVLAATAVGGPALGLAALLATGAIEGVYHGTRILGNASAKSLDSEGRQAMQGSLDSYIATQSSGDSSAIQNAAEALRKAIGAYGEWVTDDELTSSAQAEIGNTHQHVSEVQEREGREAWANLFGGIANALSGLGKMGSQAETSGSVNHSPEDTSNNSSPSASQHSTSFMPDPLESYTVAPSIEEFHPEPREKHISNRTSTTPAKSTYKVASDDAREYEEYFPEQYQPIQTTQRPPAITTSPQVRPVSQRPSFGELVKSQVSSQPRTKSSSSKSPVSPQLSQASSSTTSSSPQVHSTPPSRVQSTKEIRDSQDKKPEESIPMTAQPSPVTATDKNKVRELYATMTERMEEASALPGVDFASLAKLAEKVDKAAMAGDLNVLKELASVANQLPRETAPVTSILAKMTSQGLEQVNI